ncbi:MAG: hypothetical protein K0S32_470 [Bacteroidetes bacterium]|jgi:hypothetical protein|nr:hypothetical protein [Bacteroidota bacterium]
MGLKIPVPERYFEEDKNQVVHTGVIHRGLVPDNSTSYEMEITRTFETPQEMVAWVGKLTPSDLQKFDDNYGTLDKIGHHLYNVQDIYQDSRPGKMTLKSFNRGSGPSAGVIELSKNSQSNSAFLNSISTTSKDFVFDPKLNKLAISSKKYNLGHTGLMKGIGSNETNVVGGRIRLGANGTFESNQWSGHYGQNWTPETLGSFEKFFKQQTGKTVKGSGVMNYKDGSH